MREILFRGKTPQGEWIEGFYWGSLDPTKAETHYRAHFIHTGVSIAAPIQVFPETVGQYTGLNDNGGKRIWEGDVCKVHYYNHASANSVFIQLICFENGTFTLKCDEVEFDVYRTNCPLYNCLPPNKIYVIGNIYDDPELLDANV